MQGGPYHTLAEAACALDNPAAYAKVEQYYRHHKRQVELETNQWVIIAKIEREDNTLGGIESHMEA